MTEDEYKSLKKGDALCCRVTSRIFNVTYKNDDTLSYEDSYHNTYTLLKRDALVGYDVMDMVKFVGDKEEDDDASRLFDQHSSVLSEIHETFVRKNHDYGNSFEQSLDEFGIVAGTVRIGDKFNRLKTLSKKKKEVCDESIEDTLLDMANYCIMTAMWLRKERDGRH